MASSTLIPRRDRRHLVPFASVKLVAELQPAVSQGPAETWIGHVWDVSESGACLCFPDVPAVPASAGALQLRILPPGGGPALEVPCRLIWRDSVHGAHFLGLELATPLALASTFLAEHLASRPVATS